MSFGTPYIQINHRYHEMITEDKIKLIEERVRETLDPDRTFIIWTDRLNHYLVAYMHTDASLYWVLVDPKEGDEFYVGTEVFDNDIIFDLYLKLLQQAKKEKFIITMMNGLFKVSCELGIHQYYSGKIVFKCENDRLYMKYDHSGYLVSVRVDFDDSLAKQIINYFPFHTTIPLEGEKYISINCDLINGVHDIEIRTTADYYCDNENNVSRLDLVTVTQKLAVSRDNYEQRDKLFDQIRQLMNRDLRHISDITAYQSILDNSIEGLL